VVWGAGEFLSYEFSAASTDVETTVPGSVIDAKGMEFGNFSYINTGAHDVTLKLFGANRKDLADETQTFIGSIVAGAAAAQLNTTGSLVFRYNRASIFSTVAGQPGNINAGVYLMS
jgi:hypothetical protein